MGSTLEQIGVSVAAALFIHMIAIVLFGFAMMMRSTNIAPRCEARPRDVIYNPKPSHPAQDRGNPFLGWVPWVLKLSYKDMLTGVQGTGTRDNGLSGTLLSVNLDDVVMLRFHSFGLRVTTVGVFVFTLILLPLYWTAGCSNSDEAAGQLQNHCTNLTNYDWTTLANIEPETEMGKIELAGLSARLYIVVFCSWIVTWYSCRELEEEWKDILAMRRWYFLEKEHWRSQNEQDGALSPTQSPFSSRARQPQGSDTPKYLTDRDPWIPNPEFRDTPPSIALWSVLVGGIPSKPPNSALDGDGDDDDEASEDAESPDSAHSNRKWQLSVTSAFFDHCVPNQPGFSSSVAAVTILPNSTELASAWRKWYGAAAKLRRLRFIRKQIRDRRHYDIADDEEKAIGSTSSSTRSDHNVTKAGLDSRNIYGSVMDDDVEALFLEALEFGPEQTAVYSREFAQGASPCCPNGCFEGVITHASMDELLDLEQIALEEVHAANEALEKARKKAVLDHSEKGDQQPAISKHLSKLIAANEGEEKDGRVPSKKLSNASSVSKKGRLSNEDEGKDGGTPSKKISLASAASTVSKVGRILPGEPELKLVKNIVKNDAIQNLMGKDACEPTKNGKKTMKRTSKTKETDSHDLEDSLWKDEKKKQHSSHTRKVIKEDKPQASPPASSKSLRDSPTRQDAVSDTGFLPRSMDIAGSEAKYAPIGGSDGQHDNAPKNTGFVPSHTENHQWQSYETSTAARVRPARILTNESLSSMGSRCQTSRTHRRQPTIQEDPWALVDAIAMNSQEFQIDVSAESRGKENLRKSAGSWRISSLTEFLKSLLEGVKQFLRWTTAKSNEAVDLVTADSTYAVVTFTSRQAAVAARKVLADGRGSDRWVQLDTLPIAPLADAAPCDPITCRGCCRPVTLTVNERQKKWRFILSMLALGTIYFCYTFPLTAVTALANPENLGELFPGLQDKQSFLSSELLSSFFAALIWAAFFALCPVLFKTIANFGSNANSIVEAEYSALRYFWWFMVVSAFSGTSLQRMVLEGFDNGIQTQQITDVLRTIAATIPEQVSASWINWIIVKTSVTAPLSYMLQANTYLLDWAQLKCPARAVRGGGPGGPLPFRVYVDSGTVLLCLFSLAPAAPLVAPFAFLYFLLSTPMLRRNVIFMYRPRFDAGGVRFPFLFDMCISSMFVGQVLLATMMGLKKSLGPCVLAAVAFVPTYFFRERMRKRYLRAFNDVGLLQTSLLDGWDTAAPESFETREERRKWIVDCHRASYVPVCMASTQIDEVFTAEPALVVPTIEEASGLSPETPKDAVKDSPPADGHMRGDLQSHQRNSSNQFGYSLRRAKISSSSMEEANARFEHDLEKQNSDMRGSLRSHQRNSSSQFGASLRRVTLSPSVMQELNAQFENEIEKQKSATSSNQFGASLNRRTTIPPSAMEELNDHFDSFDNDDIEKQSSATEALNERFYSFEDTDKEKST